MPPNLDDLQAGAGLALGAFLDPAPGPFLFDEATAAPGIVVPAGGAEVVLASFTFNERARSILAAVSTSGTGFDVIYQVRINGTTILRSNHQLTPSLWDLYRIGQEVEQGPVEYSIVGSAAAGGPFAGVQARLVGWPIAGSRVAPDRFRRG